MKLFNGRLILRDKRTIVVILRRGVFKFLIGRDATIRFAHELEGQWRAMLDPMWASLVHPVKCIPFGMMSARCWPVCPDDSRINTLISERLAWIERDSPRCRADTVVDTSLLDGRVADDLGKEALAAWVKHYLGGFELPLSSAHGDFHLGNIMVFRGGLVMIDWEYYRKHSCFLFDVMHFYVQKLREEVRESWVEVAFKRLPEYPVILDLAKRFGVGCIQLVVAYAVNRSAMEALNDGANVGRISVEHREKFVRLLDYIDPLVRQA